MLYVFHVDTGAMLKLDMSLALDSVTQLKKYIEANCRIPSEKQVLLVSGGESLDPKAKVCSYSAGTDTNPIFLFSKSVIESKVPPSASVDYGSDDDFNQRVREACDLPADYKTLVHRTQLAKAFYELAEEQSKICEKLVLDQHLQQQGWAAVIANLDDITVEFKKRSDLFEKYFGDYLNEHTSYSKFLQSFNDDLQMLSKIPILPALLECEKRYLEGEGEPDAGIVENKCLTLLEWITAADNKSSMDQLYDVCAKGLEQFNDKVFDAIHKEIERAISMADQVDMKEIKGLGDRLFGLEQLMREAKRYVQEQGDLAQSFLQNQTRAGHIGDKSILPDLCASHRKQLMVMLQNHQQLCDIRRRCTRAKEELSVNLYQRLRWVMYVENAILETSQKLYIYHENLKRLRTHLEVLQQIHLAPVTYLTAVAEVVRRRKFSQAFLVWASELACHLLTIHNDEVTRRKEFQSQFEGHFLNSLFPGMEDLPPSFATQAPSIFDSTLPKVSPEEVVRLKEVLPELAEKLVVPDISAILNFFVIKSVIKGEFDKAEDEMGVEEKLVQAVSEVGLASNLDQNLLKPTESEMCLVPPGLPLLKDLDKGCESETDTEEFEKVCQSPLELHFDKDIPSPRRGTQDVATLTEAHQPGEFVTDEFYIDESLPSSLSIETGQCHGEFAKQLDTANNVVALLQDNLQISRTEHDRLKSILTKLACVSRETIAQLKMELIELKTLYMAERTDIKQKCESLTNSWENISMERDNKEKEIIKRLTTDHEMELCEFKRLAEARNEEVKCLRDENNFLEMRVKNVLDENQELKCEIAKIVLEKDRETVDLRGSLQDMEYERERIIKEAKELLTREHKAEIDNMRSRFKLMTMERSPSETSLEKIDQIKEECEKQKREAVEKALQEEKEKWDLMHRAEMDKINLEKEKKNEQITTLQNEIELLRNRENEFGESRKFDDMSASVSVFEGKVDVATSPVKHREKLTKSQTSLIKLGKLTVNSCCPGDIVLVLWDQEHECYVIFQESNIMYFLNTDCIESLGLKKSGSASHKMYCRGQVLDKNYCAARKAENRYKVPIGGKFYRVVVKPLISDVEEPKDPEPVKSKHQSHQMSESQTIGLATSEIAFEEPGPSSTPISPTRSKSNMESSAARQKHSAESSQQTLTERSSSESNR